MLAGISQFTFFHPITEVVTYPTTPRTSSRQETIKIFWIFLRRRNISEIVLRSKNEKEAENRIIVKDKIMTKDVIVTVDKPCNNCGQ